MAWLKNAPTAEKSFPFGASFFRPTASGTLYITNKRVVFAGTKKNVTYPLNKIVNFVRYRDAVQFQKENEDRPKYFLIDDRTASMKSG